MEKAAEDPPAADPAASTYSQVVFTDIPHSYPPSTTVTCRYTYSSTFQPNSRDWVGIFKVGWSTIKDYHTFIWVEQEEGQLSSQAVFKEYYLPKDEIEFYQFCYVDSTGQVRGASTPFCFRSAAEQSMESISSFDALIVTTQEQVEQNLREKDRLQEELHLMRSENETLRGALQKQQKETASFKEWNDQKEEERSKLTYQMDQIKAENEKLKNALQLQQQENKQLKEEMMIQLTKQMELEQQNAAEQKAQSQIACKTAEDKYDRALLKINQLKEERDNLKKNTDAQNEEIAQLKARLREEERVLSKAKDGIQLLQADLLSSEKEKERLSAELLKLQNLDQLMDRMKKENLELSRRLSQQNTPPNSSQDGVETLSRQLQDTWMKLEAESQECKKANDLIKQLSNELQQVKQQLTNVASLYELEQRKASKYEMQIREMNEMFADREIVAHEKEQEFRLITQQKEELTRENQGLKSEIEKVRESMRAYGSIGTTSADSTYMQFDVTSPSIDTNTTRDQEDETEQNQHVYETIGPIEGQREEEPSLVCSHCQERFPGITQEELDQHEQSHRVCPFCTMICDGMEQSVFEDHVYSHEL
ncbi:Tax1-binding-like protein 1 [Oryzias melastigma]|uniref:Tax1-binding-like protein 1 n=1 Tax=Oryzias melastigma TaxID=30732 RepID=A0A834C7M6_ORYME|nr:Tax1-binding-like protein 1 [Oryzias melastigma]